MAASSKVNASVEQANVSSGWDEARSDASTPPVTLEMKRTSPKVYAPEFGATNSQASLQIKNTNCQTIGRRVLGYLAQGKRESQRMAQTVGRKMRWLKEEHPGYIVSAAAVAGFAGGLLLRARRRRFNRYE